MTSENTQKWLLLIHQIPPKPDALRVKIWRRLQRIGAVAIKQSVYVMPFSEQSREDLSWTLKEIVDGGGDGSISEVRFMEGLTDDQVIALFHNARKGDYEKIIQQANQLMADWYSTKMDPKDPAVKGSAQVARLKRLFDHTVGIDFFKAVEKGTAALLIKDLMARASGAGANSPVRTDGLKDLEEKVWVTRKNIFVDRIACGWLIRRFVEKNALFKFVDSDAYSPSPGEIRFDMFHGEYTHEGDKCTFEVMVQRFGLRDRALAALAEVIHDIDLKGSRYGHPETDGLKALLSGMTASVSSDNDRMTQGAQLMENLYAFFQRLKGNGLPPG